ncbi:putative ABC transporter periplasmic component [Oleiphilus messinensis]|uniref:Putative ABC transporter periplasmic component n=1 Tax=Oleiphilus messinensis TaxID=141451 RepID=A0A1Y0I883_9GAMM|nr:NADAR family protein [Oleiphilus messinensis]ARU56671.1 putative ABC transporter periplasmic component [Oleiphilus messinensis]
MIRSNQALVAAIAAGQSFKYVFFWGHRKSSAVTKTCFSQWYEAPFQKEGVLYPTAEHFMMAAKAQLFGDSQTRERIFKAKTPGEAKRLGREVNGFDEAIWTAERFNLVVAGNMAKFSQHPELLSYLLGTGERVLVEASPLDKIWGIGLAADDPLASSPDVWPGLNLLGYALMEVRSRLRAA